MLCWSCAERRGRRYGRKDHQWTWWPMTTSRVHVRPRRAYEYRHVVYAHIHVVVERQCKSRNYSPAPRQRLAQGGPGGVGDCCCCCCCCYCYTYAYQYYCQSETLGPSCRGRSRGRPWSAGRGASAASCWSIGRSLHRDDAPRTTSTVVEMRQKEAL